MSYTIADLENDINRIVADLRELRAAKGHDYSGTADTLDNLREFGAFGVLVRIGDKFKRLKHIFNGEAAVKTETRMDTVNDLINYALYLRILMEQEEAGK